MHKVCFLLFAMCISAWPESAAAIHVRNALATLPRSFEAATPAEYLSRGRGYNVDLTATEVNILSSSNRAGALRMKLVGANRQAKIEPLDPLPAKSSYFIGSDPSKWRTDIPNYGAWRCGVCIRGST